MALLTQSGPARAQDLPLKKLGGFGGKLGEQLAALGCSTAGQVGGAGVRCTPGWLQASGLSGLDPAR